MTPAEKARELAAKYKAAAERIKDGAPLALTAAAINSTWRNYEREYPEIAGHFDEFLRVIGTPGRMA